ncbi:MAG TPA: dTMP kinase [Methanotrichaceae archaeon]|nr:dTMP kinase [Methanotrichaceae archaeon]
MRGILITFEGIDGSGKSTVIAEIARKLAEGERLPFRGKHFLFTAEPTEGEEGHLIREKLKRDSQTTRGQASRTRKAEQLEELFLFMADHAHHLEETVLPALEQGMVVISDRYSDSRVAYQGATLQGIVPHPLEWVRELHRPWSIVPDKTILFSIDPALAVERCLSRSEETGTSQMSKDPEKFEREEFLKEVAENFDRMAKGEPERFVTIDANCAKAEILEETMRVLAELLSETERP